MEFFPDGVQAGWSLFVCSLTTVISLSCRPGLLVYPLRASSFWTVAGSIQSFSVVAQDSDIGAQPPVVDDGAETHNLHHTDFYGVGWDLLCYRFDACCVGGFKKIIYIYFYILFVQSNCCFWLHKKSLNRTLAFVMTLSLIHI